MMHTSGISFEGDVLDLGLEHKIVSRSGAWFKFNETYLGQGKEKARAYLMENKALAEEIRELIMASGGYVGPEGREPGEAEEVEDEAELADS
jgi:recombination protein RecA